MKTNIFSTSIRIVGLALLPFHRRTYLQHRVNASLLWLDKDPSLLQHRDRVRIALSVGQYLEGV